MESSERQNSQVEPSSSGAVIPVVLTLLFGGLILMVIKRIFASKSKDGQSSVPAESENTLKKAARNDQKPSKKTEALSKTAATKFSGKYSHPLFVTTLKGYAGDINDGDFSASGKYFLTSAQDGSLHVWTCSEVLSDHPNKEARSSRLNLEYDNALLIRFSPDSKAVLGRMEADNVVRIFKMAKKTDGSWTPPQKALDIVPNGSFGETLFVDIQCNGKFIMTAHEKTQIGLWSLKGAMVHVIVTNLGTLHDAKISPCGRFVAASGFTPEARIWAVTFDKQTGELVGAEKAFELTGHSSGVLSLAFSGDSSHMVSLSKDKTFRVWDVAVDWQRKQSPRLLQQASWAEKPPTTAHHSQVALTNDARCVVVSHGTELSIFSAANGQLKCRIVDPLISEKDAGLSLPIKRLFLDPSSEFILALGGRMVRIFRNVPATQIAVEALQESIKFASQESVRVRLQQQLEDAHKKLAFYKERYPDYFH